MNDRMRALDATLAYDPDAPLRSEIERTTEELDISISRLRYEGIRRQRVTSLLVEPDGEGPYPALIFLHPFDEDKNYFLPEAKALADEGFISLLVDAPHKRPDPHAMELNLHDSKALRAFYLQMIGDVRRSFDILEQLPITDRHHMGVVGERGGADLAPAIAALDPRAMNVVSIATVPRRSVYWSTSKDPAAAAIRDQLGRLPLRRYVQALSEFDVLAMVELADASNWLFQSSRDDIRVPSEELEGLRAVVPEADFLLYDETEMASLKPERDRLTWLERRLRPR